MECFYQLITIIMNIVVDKFILHLQNAKGRLAGKTHKVISMFCFFVLKKTLFGCKESY